MSKVIIKSNSSMGVLGFVWACILVMKIGGFGAVASWSLWVVIFFPVIVSIVLFVAIAAIAALAVFIAEVLK